MEHGKYSIGSELVAYVFGIILWIPVCLLICPLLLFFAAMRTIVIKASEKFRPDLIPLEKVDYFLALSPNSYAYTSQIWRVDGDIEVEAFKRHFHKCFLSSEEDRERYLNLYCYFVQYLGYLFKKRVKSIDLNYHIQEITLENGLTVEDFVGKWMVKHDTDTESNSERPLWMIKILNEKGCSTVVFKLHHGFCDGYTMVHLVGKLSGEPAPYMFREPVPPFLKKVKCFLQLPYLFVNLWIEMHIAGKKSLIPKGTISGKEDWLISFATLDLKTVKGVRRATKTNFVSVLMSIQVGALKRLFKELKIKNEAHGEKIFLGHSCGWPLHPVMDKGGMANHLTLCSIKASMKIEDPLERLLDLDRNFQESRAKGYPILAYYGMFNVSKIQPCFISEKLIKMCPSFLGMEIGMSALLCSSRPHYLMGKLVRNLYLPVIAPSIFPRIKMLTVPISHSGYLDISINASTALVKNQRMLDRIAKVYFTQELEELKARCKNLME